jgi:hypothetical protein
MKSCAVTTWMNEHAVAAVRKEKEGGRDGGGEDKVLRFQLFQVSSPYHSPFAGGTTKSNDDNFILLLLLSPPSLRKDLFLLLSWFVFFGREDKLLEGELQEEEEVGGVHDRPGT